MPTTTRDPEVRRIADEAVRRAKGFEDWQAYEAAKGYVRRQHPGREDYDAIIDAIKTRLEI
jgi:hypothetical protein